MTAATLAMWVTLIGGLLMGGQRLLRALLAVVRALESVGELGATLSQLTEDMREWQGETEGRLIRLETIQMTGAPK